MSDESKAGGVHVGCQGWLYHDWTTRAGGAAVFYPAGARADEMLGHYSRAFVSVEVDSTFYAVPSERTVKTWAQRTPDGFTFSPKLPQEITHTHVLAVEESKPVLQEFCARMSVLGAKLGVVLVQLPPAFANSPGNMRSLAEFLPLLPESIRWAIEFRHASWMDEETADLLRAHAVAPALVEGQWLRRGALFEMAERVAVKFAYIRWMGARDLTKFDAVVRPQDDNLKLWADRIASLRQAGTNVYAYFSNYYEGFAPASALKLNEMLGAESFDPRELEVQPSLF